MTSAKDEFGSIVICMGAFLDVMSAQNMVKLQKNTRAGGYEIDMESIVQCALSLSLGPMARPNIVLEAIHVHQINSHPSVIPQLLTIVKVPPYHSHLSHFFMSESSR